MRKRQANTIKFEILVRMNRTGNETWEQYEKYVGEQNSIRGYGLQPEFTGDIHRWGKEIVAWFNQSEKNPEYHREFLEARMGHSDPKNITTR